MDTEINQDDLDLDLDAILAEEDPEFDDSWEPDDEIISMLGEDDFSIVAAGGLDRNNGGAEKLRRYWTVGPGSAKIMWGTAGDWTRCVRHLGKYLGPRAKGYCALRHKEMTGMWTGDQKHRQMFGRTKGKSVFSSDLLREEEAVIEQAALRARHATARNRINAMVAGAAVVEPTTSGARFRIPLIIPTDHESGDGRFIQKGALSHRDLPLPLMWQIKTATGHDGSVVVGRIDHMEETADGYGNAYGYFDTGEYGQEAERLVRNKFLRGVSADMDKFEATQEEIEEAAVEGEETTTKERTTITKARIMGVTIVPKPAFQEAQIFLEEDPYQIQEDELIPDGIYVEDTDPIEAAALVACGMVAGAIPVVPPSEWFVKPQLNGPTPLTIDDDGHVYGHIAAWHVDHIGLQFGTKPPRSRSDYAYFHTGVVRTDAGSDIPVGQLTLAGGHAGLEASATEAIKHYDDTASAIADVHAGEDQFGIWVAGALRPGASPEQIRALRASAPSGDWRPIRGHLELVAVCQVNVPGFPTARARVASGQVMALVAAGAAPLAQMKKDPYQEMSERIEKLEQFKTAELSAQIDAARAKFAAVKAERASELSSKVQSLSDRFAAASDFAFVPKAKRDKLAKEGKALPDGSFPIENEADLKKAIQAYGRASNKTAARKHIMKRARALGKADLIPDSWKSAQSAAVASSVEDLRSRTATFASTLSDKKRLEALEKIAEQRGINIDDLKKPSTSAPVSAPADQIKTDNGGEVPDNADPKVVSPEKGEKKGIYTPQTQPRDDTGRFRLVLARLKENLGVSGGQEVVEKIQEAEKLDNAGDYTKAAGSAVDLLGLVDRIDTKALNPESLENVRDATRMLGETISNLPLPFDNQTQKVRYSDLPPALRDLIEKMITKVEEKIGKKDAAIATAEVKSFMSGADYYSQGEVSKQMNKLLRLLT